MARITRSSMLARIRGVADEVLPDSGRYKFRFKIRSESSDKLYLVSYDDAGGAKYWVCSCMGCIRHGTCKHLNSMGLAGRQLAAALPLSDPRRQLPS